MKSEIRFCQFRFPDDFNMLAELWAQCGRGLRTGQ